MIFRMARLPGSARTLVELRIGGLGMIPANVFEAVAEQQTYTGFAFGFGINRWPC